MFKIAYGKIVFIILGLSVGVFGNYEQAIEYYEMGKYHKAYPMIVKEAKKGTNKAAQYRLAEMYEKGLGTKVDFKESMYWYKQAASKYAYVNKKTVPKKDIDTTKTVSTQIGNESIKAGNEYALAKMDTNTPETKSWMSAMLDGDFFGLQPYKTNFFLPLSYAKDKPLRYLTTTPFNTGKYATYNENTEVEFQLSLKKDLTYDLFGLNEYIAFAYTQKVWWQLYDNSGPFRETNYLPEIFMTIPTSKSLDDSIGLKAVKFGFLHESNGQEGYRSRSWNRLYATALWQWDNLFLATRVLYRLKEDRKSEEFYNGELPVEEVIGEAGGDDNPDITDYLGYGDIDLNYLYKKHKFGLMLRNNLDFDDNKGAVEFSYSYPLFDSPNTFWYVKIFNGYGNSLIEYNENVTRASFGFAFSGSLY